VVAYRRTHAREVADVLLNFSDREVALDLCDHAGRDLYSSRRGELEAAPVRRALGAYEGIVLLDPTPPRGAAPCMKGLLGAT
jgi:hypothetical protein